MDTKYILKLPHRLKARKVGELILAKRARERALRTKDWVFETASGGGVGMNYVFEAATECAVAVSDPNGLTVVWVNKCDAKAIGTGGVSACRIAEACLPGSKDWWDRRVKRPERKTKALDLLKKAHAESWSPLEKLASAAED